MDTEGTLEFSHIYTKAGSVAFDISVTGLHGGHSGDEIHKGYGNSVKIMNRLLLHISDHFKISLADFNGGNLRNAIPREAFATFVCDKTNSNKVTGLIKEFKDTIALELGDLEKDLKISLRETAVPEFTMDEDSQSKFLKALSCCPHGVIAWSKDMEDLVETSTNLASAKFSDNNTIRIITTQRSSVEKAKHDTGGAVELCLKKAGAVVEHSDGYPGWSPNMKSEILRITRQSYRSLFGKDPLVKAIHAGLECGLVYEKLKNIDMISFGPTIRGAHTPEEMIEINTAQMFWDLLIDVICKIPEE
jgi:dipeptidase D